MRFRTRLLVVFTVFGVALFLVGSSAFTTVSAERTVSVNVSDDSDALLEITPHSGPNGAYAEQTSGELEISLDNIKATGVNQNANTTLSKVFNITNQGTQTTDVYITKNGPNASLVTFEDDSGSPIEGGVSNAVSVPVGGTVQVTIVINTTVQDLSGGDTLLNSITIHAEG
ncbi:MAG: hypothetical protein ABEH88_09125 [Halobacteriales archaeon]